MKDFITFLLLTILTLLTAQSQGVIVNYDLDLILPTADGKYSNDVIDYFSLMKNRVQQHRGQLIISKNISKYSTVADIKIGDDDSIDLATKFTLNSNDIYYTQNDQIIRLTETLLTPLTVKHEPFFEWELLNELIEIKGIKCYRAVCNFKDIQGNDKKVEACYAPSLPYTFGPAGFNGLPGLIVKIKVNNLVYTFNKLETTKTPEKIALPTKDILTLEEFQAILKTSENKFNKF